VSPPGAVVIGIGNPYRRDDGLGPALVEAIGRLSPEGASAIVADGEPSQLLDAWAGAPLAVVVDAVLCAPPAPGRIHRTELAGPSAGAAQAGGVGVPATAASTHGLGIPDAVRLAEALGRMPDRKSVV